MTTAETFVRSIHVWLNATGRAPLEMVLPQALYLRLAADLGLDDPSAPLYPVFDPPTYSLSRTTAEKTLRARSVRVGASFVFVDVVVRKGAP